MERSIEGSLETLRKSTSRLNSISDSAARVVKGVESFLARECSAGVPADVLVESEDTGAGCSVFTSLAYRRVGGRFRVTVVTGFDDDPESWSTTPWSNSSRELKLLTFPKLPALVNAVAEEVDKRLSEAEESCALASKMLNALDETAVTR